MQGRGYSGPALADSPTQTTFGAYQTDIGTALRKGANVIKGADVEPVRRDRFNQFQITT